MCQFIEILMNVFFCFFCCFFFKSSFKIKWKKKEKKRSLFLFIYTFILFFGNKARNKRRKAHVGRNLILSSFFCLKVIFCVWSWYVIHKVVQAELISEYDSRKKNYGDELSANNKKYEKNKFIGRNNKSNNE